MPLPPERIPPSLITSIWICLLFYIYFIERSLPIWYASVQVWYKPARSSYCVDFVGVTIFDCCCCCLCCCIFECWMFDCWLVRKIWPKLVCVTIFWGDERFRCLSSCCFRGALEAPRNMCSCIFNLKVCFLFRSCQLERLIKSLCCGVADELVSSSPNSTNYNFEL